MTDLIFSKSQAIELCSNIFIEVPVILKFDDTPLIEVIQHLDAGYTTCFNIYHNDGTKLAVAKGSRLFCTEAGKAIGVTLRHEDKLTVCEFGGSTAFELRRDAAAAIKAHAELYTPTGQFIKCHDDMPALLDAQGNSLQIGGMTMMCCTIARCPVGIQLHSDGSMGIG